MCPSRGEDGPIRLVDVSSLNFSQEAMTLFGLAFRDISQRLCLPLEEVASLSGELYWKPETGDLMFILRLGQAALGMDADVCVEIPEEHWSFRERSYRVH